MIVDKLIRAAGSKAAIVGSATVLTGCEAVIQVYGAGWLPVPQWGRLLVIFGVVGGAFLMRYLASKRISNG